MRLTSGEKRAHAVRGAWGCRSMSARASDASSTSLRSEFGSGAGAARTEETVLGGANMSVEPTGRRGRRFFIRYLMPHVSARLQAKSQGFWWIHDAGGRIHV